MTANADRVVNLVLAGGSVPSIAEQLDLPEEVVARMAADGVAARTGTSGVDAARLDLARLDVLLNGIWRAASRGDLPAVAQALKITQQRANLLATIPADAPDGGEAAGPTVADTLEDLKGPHPLADLTPLDIDEGEHHHG